MLAPASLEPDAAVDPDAPPMTPAGPVAHRFLKGFSGGGSVAIVGRDGTIEWEMPVAEHEANDAWLLPGGNVLFGFKNRLPRGQPRQAGAVGVPGRGRRRDPLLPAPARRQLLVGESRADGTTVVQEMNRAKEVLRMFTVQQGGGDPQPAPPAAQDARRDLPALPSSEAAARPGGGCQRQGPAHLPLRPVRGHPPARRQHPHRLRRRHRVIEVDPPDQMVWEVKENDIPGNRLGFVAGLQRLANGNTVICNWSGHSGLDDQPQVFELTRDKKLVWEVKDQSLDKISTIEILDPSAAVDGSCFASARRLS
jgi:hypothetical protein